MAVSGNEELIERELELFKREYNLYFTRGETKPQNIGAPYLLHNSLSKIGVLLIHGLMAAPEEVRQWADFLYSKGFTVYAPRLSGHGTSASDLSTKGYDDWMESVNRGHAILKSCCDKIVVAGFSTGAGLALYQAIKKPGDFYAVISISAPLKFRGFSSSFVELINLFNRFLLYAGLSRFRMLYARNHPDNPEINYNRCPIRSIAEVRALMRRVYRLLPDIEIPSLIMQGRDDPKVDGRSGEKIFNRINRANSSYSAINFNQHGVIRGDIGRTVFCEVGQFLQGLC